ncbi:uncharacterized protein [Coffea arabica]|uniref:TLC domain-containing protein n=1 Tax=Coffea arabica TaxID=13443 RepID=A0A6P6UI09_COFAR|nr:transmembrane protein 136-like [Coffea arabica]
MEDYIVGLIVAGVFFWTILFLLTKRIFQERSFDFSLRVVSSIHAIIAVTLASLSIQDWSCPIFPLPSKSSPMQIQTLAISGAYLIFDLACCQFSDNINLDTIFHHLVCILGIWAGLASERYGSEMVAALWLGEISGPFLHLRDLLKELGYRGTDLNLAIDILFAIIFTAARMIVGPYLTYAFLFSDSPLLMKAVALGLQLVSAFWVYKIVRMVIHKLSSKGMPSSQPAVDGEASYKCCVPPLRRLPQCCGPPQ